MSHETQSPHGQIAKPATEEKAHSALSIITREGAVMECELSQAETRIGKGPDNDIILGDAAVSTSHAVIRYDGQRATLIDAGSRNGTFLNEARLTEPRELKSGDVIKLGHCKLTFRSLVDNQTITLTATEIIGANAVPPPPVAPPAPATPALPSEDTVARALVHSKIVAAADIERVQKHARGRRLYRALLEEKVVTELGLRDLLSRTFNLTPVDLRTAEIDIALAQRLKPQFLREKLMAPLLGPPGELLLAVADPTDKAALDEIKKTAGRPLAIRLATASEIAAQLDKQFVPRLVGVLPSGEKLEIPINQPEIALGKAPHNKIVLNDPTVSATHAALLSRDGGYGIVDLGSSNGTFVNGTRLTTEAWTLQHGDKIQLGKVLFTFRNPAETVENKTARLSLEALEEIRRRASLTGAGVAAGVAANFAGAPAVLTPEEEKERKKSEKEKDKKKKSDERIRAALVNSGGRILATIVGSVLTVVITVMVLRPSQSNNNNSGSSGKTGGETAAVVKLTPGSWEKFDTGLFGKRPEASGAIAVPNSNGLLIADDGRKNEILWMPINESGLQAGDLKPVPLNVNFVDAEAITYGNNYFYVITSQSDPANSSAQTLMRFAFNPQTQTLSSAQAEIVSGLRAFLLQNVPEITARGAAPGLEGGLNIEGLAYDPNHERLLLGLRSPFVGNQAVLVPLKLINPLMPLSLNNLKVDQPSVITLTLDGQGIRDISYDPHVRQFLILSGAPETEKKTEFGLWEWSGNANEQPRRVLILEDKYKPEGITSVTINGQSFVIVVGDAGNYLKLDYK